MKKILLPIIIFTIFFLFSCGKEYHIEYDLDGGYLENAETIFTNPNKYELPIPSKDGYFFIGWFDGEKIVEKLEKQDYELKALWIDNPEYGYIDDNQIFIQDELNYYVYLMRDGCSWCEKIKDDVLRYQYKTNYNEKLKKIYVVNLQNSKKSSSILRTYEENDGFLVDNIEKWEDLYIPSTPTLIEIKEVNEKRVAGLVTNGATNIKNQLAFSLVDTNDYSSKTELYTITYDLNGGVCDNLITSFNKWNNVYLPIPTKEGFYFGGWTCNGTYVKEINHQNYTLSANWVEEFELTEVEEKDIFALEGNYYIYFLKGNDDNSKMINVIKKYNALTDYYQVDPIYIVDLDKCELIYRIYHGEEESTFHVDGATSIDELYISRKKSMIKIENKEAKFIGDTYKSLVLYLEELIKLDLSE